tara:strand:+ start:2004 stop:3665 length:1662 start_codon:yes stop_codon:yes gene_type:complete
MAEEDKKKYGMGPGQSMAMAGNTGLASFTQKDIEKVQQAKRDFNQFSGRDKDQGASFTDIGQEIDELGSKYRRPVKIADGLGAFSDGSGRAYTPNDFNSDGSFRSFTASRPTFSQVMGDAGRAFKGYNSINYDNSSQGYSPISMRNTPGLIEQGILSPLTTVARAALGATNDLAGKIKPLFSGTVDLFKEGLGALNDVKQQIFMNPEKYKFMQEDEEIKNLNEKKDEIERFETFNKKIEADRKQFEELLNISVLQDNSNTRPRYAATGDTRPPLNTINPESSREGRELFQQDNAYSKIPPGITSLANNIVTEDDRTSSLENLINNSKREISPFSFLNPFDKIPTGVALTETFSPETLNLSDMGLILGDTTVDDLTKSGKEFYDLYKEEGMSNEEALKNIKVLQSEPSNVSKYGDLILSSNSITPFNNAFNLEFANQDGATPGYGGKDDQRFASFPNATIGLREGFNRVSEIVGDGRSTKSFLDIYAPRSDNEETYDSYLSELVKKVGYTIEPEEVKDLGKAIIKQENDPKVSDQYLKYLQTNANKIYDGIISS